MRERSRLTMFKKEDAHLYPLAAYGLARGVHEVFIQPHLSARKAWLGLLTAATLYELAAPPNELLSEGVDRALEHHRGLTIAAIGITALHLINILPPALDPYVQGLHLIKGHH